MKTIFWKQYISRDVCQTLCDWTLGNPDALCDARSSARRILRSGEHAFPPEAFSIHSDIKSKFPLLDSDFGHYWHKGIVTGVIYPGGVFEPHVDANYKRDGLSVVGFNLLVSQPESGGIVTVEGQPYQMNCGDVIAYLITDCQHSVSAISGSTPRVMWHWRFYVDKEKWENQ